MSFKVYSRAGADAARAATHARVRALGDTPVSASPPTVTVQTGAGLLTQATSTVTGTLVHARWTAATYYPIGAVVLDPTAYTTKWRRNTSGTSGSAFDATEQAQWTVVPDSTKVQNPIRWNATFLRWSENNASDATGQGFIPRAPARTDGSETGQYTFQPTQWSLDFDWYTSAGALEIPVYDRTQVRFIVDGQYVSATPTNAVTTSDFNWKYIKLSGVAAGYHRVRVEVGSSSFCAGVKIATGDVLYPPSLPTSASFCILGDSYIEGATDVSGTTTADLRGYGAQLARLLGFSNYVPLGIAATGFSLSGTQKYLGRISDVNALQPDYLLIQGSLNDYGNRSTTLTSEVQSFLSALTALNLTKTRVLFSGAPYYGTSPNIPVYNAIIKPLIVAAGYDFLDTDDWGPGPSAFNGADAVHPTAMGHDYLARRYAAALSGKWGLPM